MRRDDNIGKTHQSLNGIVLNNIAAEVAEKQFFFLFIHINTQAAQLSIFKCMNSSLGIHQTTTAGVDEHHALLHGSQRGFINHVAGAIHQRAMQGDNVCRRKHVGQVGVSNAECFQIFVGHHIKSQHFATKAQHNFSKSLTNVAGAHNANRFAKNIKPQQSIQRKILLPYPVVSFVRFAVKRHHQRHGMLCHSLW